MTKRTYYVSDNETFRTHACRMRPLYRTYVEPPSRARMRRNYSVYRSESLREELASLLRNTYVTNWTMSFPEGSGVTVEEVPLSWEPWAPSSTR